MGLDVGSKTVGVAVSDLLGWTAQGVEIIRIDEDQQEFGLERLAQLVQQYQVEQFVVGLPKNMDNSEGERVTKSQEYGKMIATKFNLPVNYIDERLTTVQAQRMLIEEADVSRHKRHQVIDEVAAMMILQNYLDKLAYQKANPQ